MPQAATLTDNSVTSLAERVAADEPLTKAQLKIWRGWSDSTVDRYVARGLPIVRRAGVRDYYIPSRVLAWLRGEEPQRPVPRRGRPPKRR
jgi:hypothetical protein